ncbi:hypothetical protein O7A70_00195 [Mesorhizobium sp. Cs1299R1N1]|uniref:hypothetical protein n=1 Tax=Mesorhizobium sp. Cs1299R1N1 TaxID=3015172 RepID=UPI00301B9420
MAAMRLVPAVEVNRWRWLKADMLATYWRLRLRQHQALPTLFAFEADHPPAYKNTSDKRANSGAKRAEL